MGWFIVFGFIVYGISIGFVMYLDYIFGIFVGVLFVGVFSNLFNCVVNVFVFIVVM